MRSAANIALAFESGAVGHGQQFLGLVAGQPVAQTGSLLPDIRDVGHLRSQLRIQDAAALGLADQVVHR